MTRVALLVSLIASVGLSACSGNATVACVDSERYASSRAAPPVRVPDDLTVPDETDALRIPDPFPPRERPSDLPCLETPPDFFEGQQDEEDGA